LLVRDPLAGYLRLHPSPFVASGFCLRLLSPGCKLTATDKVDLSVTKRYEFLGGCDHVA
jgi:hypothetical protein